ncbi:GTP cyclohydrolase I FolE [Candidatus Pacearchaeota archaeon]|nr:GTP cyclohydrolase I FolE [Candidatus Pacearchaeota archaeon]
MTFDQKKVREGVKMILVGIGEDPTRDGLRETPDRVAKMYKKLLDGRSEKPEKHLKMFNEKDATDMVVVKDIPIYTFCEHHFVLMTGYIHIAYIPDGKVIGLSKLVRLARMYCKRLQTQERLVHNIAECLVKHLSENVMVYTELEHWCMTIRGVRSPGTKTVVSAVRGKFLKREHDKQSPKEEFFKAIGR